MLLFHSDLNGHRTQPLCFRFHPDAAFFSWRTDHSESQAAVGVSFAGAVQGTVIGKAVVHAQQFPVFYCQAYRNILVGNNNAVCVQEGNFQLRHAAAIARIAVLSAHTESAAAGPTGRITC